MVSTRLNAVVPVASGATASTSDTVSRRHWGYRWYDWVYEYTHTEYSGFYSLEKLRAFQVSGEPRFAIQLMSVLLATVPTIIVVMGLELIPLQDPTLPWSQNPGFYAREFVRSWLGGIGSNLLVQEFIPQLRQPWPRLLLLSLAQMSTYFASLVCIAQVFHIFPVPLSNITPLLPALVVAIAIRYVVVKDVLGRNPELKPIYDRMERFTGLAFSIIFLYCAYGFAFRRVDSFAQIMLSAALFALKQWVKHRTWELSHVHDHHDLSAESISCGVHLFHALFTTTCLQSARSAGTFVVVLVLNLVQDVLAFSFLQRISIQVDALTKTCGGDGVTRRTSEAWNAEWTERLLRLRAARPVSHDDRDPPQPSIMRLQSAHFRFKHELPAAMHVDPNTGGSSTALHEEATHAQAIANLLHCREIVLLRLFVDIFVPLFYFTYCYVMRFLLDSNWRYFENLAGLNQQTLLRLGLSILPLVAIKLVVMCELCRLFKAHGQPSGLRQLAFVIKAQRWSMQTWFTLNFVQLVDFQLAHMGNDLSFRFEWLRK